LIQCFVLNCNVGPFATSYGIFATKIIFHISTLVTCRDEFSYSFIKKYNNHTYLYPDLVFSYKKLNQNRNVDKTIGISIYTGYTAQLKCNNYSYSNFISQLINILLQDDSSIKIKLFIFNTGYNSDFPTAYKILDQIINKQNVEIIHYNDLDFFNYEFSKCSTIVGTRFHSIVLGYLYNIPTLPIIYSNKTYNFLKDIKYSGCVIDYHNCSDADPKIIANYIRTKDNLLTINNEGIINKAAGHLSILDKYLKI